MAVRAQHQPALQVVGDQLGLAGAAHHEGLDVADYGDLYLAVGRPRPGVPQGLANRRTLIRVQAGGPG